MDPLYAALAIYFWSGAYVGLCMWRGRKTVLKLALPLDWFFFSLFAVVPVLNTVTAVVLFAGAEPDH